MLPGPQEHPCSWRSGCGVQGPFGGCGERLPRSSATSLSKGWPPFPWEVLWAKPLPFDSHVSLTIPGLCLTLVPLIGPDPGPHLQADISAWPYPCPQCSPAYPGPRLGAVGWFCLGGAALPAPGKPRLLAAPWCTVWAHCWHF